MDTLRLIANSRLRHHLYRGVDARTISLGFFEMDWKEILLAAGYNEADAVALSDELNRLKVTESKLANLPRSVGLKFLGFPTYKVVHDLTANLDYLNRFIPLIM